MMHFPPYSRCPPISEHISESMKKFSQRPFFKISVYTQKFPMTFLVIYSKFATYSIFAKLYISPIFPFNLHVFCLFYMFFSYPPNWTMMHFHALHYWKPLTFSRIRKRMLFGAAALARSIPNEGFLH